MRNSKAVVALRAFVAAINATGGVAIDDDGCTAPVADEEWVDLGDAYLWACEALDERPLIARSEDDQKYLSPEDEYE